MGSETTLLPHLDPTGLALNADARFRHVFSEGFDPILLTDHTGKVLDGNRQALSFFGIDRKALLEPNIRDLHHPAEPLPDVSRLTGPGEMAPARANSTMDISQGVDITHLNAGNKPAV